MVALVHWANGYPDCTYDPCNSKFTKETTALLPATMFSSSGSDSVSGTYSTSVLNCNGCADQVLMHCKTDCRTWTTELSDHLSPSLTPSLPLTRSLDRSLLPPPPLPKPSLPPKPICLYLPRDEHNPTGPGVSCSEVQVSRPPLSKPSLPPKPICLYLPRDEHNPTGPSTPPRLPTRA